MGWIQDKIAEFRNKKAEEKEMKNHYLQQKYVEEDYEQKRISHYERELIRHKEELRQKRIKEIVKGICLQNKRMFLMVRKISFIIIRNYLKWGGRDNGKMDTKGRY